MQEYDHEVPAGVAGHVCHIQRLAVGHHCFIEQQVAGGGCDGSVIRGGGDICQFCGTE